MHVDGFRFDLGTILAREPDGFDDRERLPESLSARTRCWRSVKLIAEPWDCGPGGYQVGGFPPGWAEWNDKFRDTVRDFWRATRAARRRWRRGSAPRPTCSTIAAASPGPASTSSPRTTASRSNDCVSYNDKHNEANGEDNRDGNSDNRSWNCGVEGPTDDPTINALRERQMRNMLATLLLSQGTPMLLAGDEFGRTQQRQQQRLLPGQRDQLGRLGDRRERAGAGRVRPQADRAAQRLSDPAPLALPHRRSTTPDIDVKDVTLDRRRRHGDDRHEDWDDGNARCFGMLMDGRAQATGITRRGDDATLLIVFNAHHDVVNFTLPPCFDGARLDAAARHQRSGFAGGGSSTSAQSTT